MRLTLVTEAAHPALAAETLPCFLACAVQAAGEGHAPVTVLSLPPRFAPERGREKGNDPELLIHHPQSFAVPLLLL